MLFRPSYLKNPIHSINPTQVEGIAFGKSSREVGIDFENKVHETLVNNLKLADILREKDVIKLYGRSCTAIDHMFDVPDTNISICIQTKWKKTKESLDYIHHFIKCIELVQKTSSKCIQGILLAAQPITSNGTSAFDFENRTNPHIRLTNIHLDPMISQENPNNQDILVEKLLYYLHNTYQIWTYEPDGAIVMRH